MPRSINNELKPQKISLAVSGMYFSLEIFKYFSAFLIYTVIPNQQSIVSTTNKRELYPNSSKLFHKV